MNTPAESNNENFTAAYDAYADVIFRHALFRLSDREKAVDLVQETFLRYCKYVANHQEPVKNVKSFLYHIANNLIIDEWRKKKTQSLDTLVDAGFQVEDEELKDLSFYLEARNAIDLFKTLTDDERDVLSMRYVDDLPIKNIAELLGESENTISVRIHRSLNKLRTQLGIKL